MSDLYKLTETVEKSFFRDLVFFLPRSPSAVFFFLNFILSKCTLLGWQQSFPTVDNVWYLFTDTRSEIKLVLHLIFTHFFYLICDITLHLKTTVHSHWFHKKGESMKTISPVLCKHFTLEKVFSFDLENCSASEPSQTNTVQSITKHHIRPGVYLYLACEIILYILVISGSLFKVL